MNTTKNADKVIPPEKEYERIFLQHNCFLFSLLVVPHGPGGVIVCQLKDSHTVAVGILERNVQNEASYSHYTFKLRAGVC